MPISVATGVETLLSGTLILPAQELALCLPMPVALSTGEASYKQKWHSLQLKQK